VKVEDDVVLRLYRDEAERWKTQERRRVEELVVRDESGAPEARRAAAAALAQALAGGETLAAAAARLGEAVAGPVDLGWVTRGELAPALDAAVWALPAAGVSPPVEGRGGLHVLRVVEIDPARVRPFEEVRDEIRAQEGQRRFELATREFLADLERQAFVVETVPAEAEGWREALPASAEAQALGAFAPQRLPAPEATPAPPEVEPSEAPPAPPPPG
jgi:parvulin-like peptidyl-prolyl isomerase